MSLQNLANQMQSTGRGGDTMLVHMNPKEVAGLQQLAMAHGGSLTTNPETGLPEAGFLSNLLPTVIGMALAPATGGASLGITNAFQTAALVGAGTGLMTGSLKKGLMAGLGAFGGASMAPGIMGASTAAAPAAAATNPAFAPGAAFNQAGTASLATPAVANAGFAQGFAPGQAFNQAGTIQNIGAGGGAAGNSAFVPGQAFNQAGNIRQATQVVGGQTGAPSVLNQFGSGLKNILTNQGGAGSDFLKDNKMSLLSSAASALMTPEEEEEKKRQEVMALERYAPQYTRYEPSVRPAGSTAERTYFAADGGMVPGPVEQMSQMNAVGGNTRYPMASQTTPTYASPAERPISQNVIYPATDAAVGSYTGMAGGGIASLTSFASGGKAKSEAQINEENAAKEYAAWSKERAADKAKAKAEADKRTAELKKEYTDRINSFNKDTQAELKQKQKDIAGEKDREAKARMQRELKEWQSGRASELKGIQTDQSSAFKDVTNEYTNRVKDLDTEIKERQALRNFETDVFKKGYTGFSGDIKGDDLTALNKGYDTEIGKQKSEAEKAKAALDAAKKTGIQSLIDRAQDTYNQQQGEYDEASKAKESRISQFKEETKRGSTGIATRGAYTTTTGDVDAIKQQIADIKKNPAGQSGMGGMGGVGSTYLSTEQQKQIKDLESKLAGMSAAAKTYNPATGQYETKEEKKFQELKKAPTYDTKIKKIMEEDDVRQMFEEVAGRKPTEAEMTKYLGKSMTEDTLAKGVSSLAELGALQKFTDADLNAQAKYYWGRDMTKGELAYFKDPANKVSSFNALRTTMVNNPAYLQNLNKINQAAFSKEQSAAQIAAEGPLTQEQVSSAYQDLFGKPPTPDQLQAALSSGASLSQLKTQLKGTPAYATKMTQPLVPEIKQAAPVAPPVTPISQTQIDAYRQAYNAPTPQTASQVGLAPLFTGTTGQGGYTYTPPQQQASIEGALPYQDVINRLGIGGVYQQIANKAPELQPGVQFNVPQGYTPIGQTARPQGMAVGGMAEGGYDLGGYSDGGRLLKGPGDGVSDSIPASIGNRQPARLADGEFVIPARIVSELGNGSTEAGARQLYAMMDRVQKKRRGTVGKDKVAVNSRAAKMLPA